MVLLDIYDEKAIAARTNENALNSSSNEKKRFDQTNSGSGQPDKPDNGANPSKSRGSDKSGPHDADPGPRR